MSRNTAKPAAVRSRKAGRDGTPIEMFGVEEETMTDPLLLLTLALNVCAATVYTLAQLAALT